MNPLGTFNNDSHSRRPYACVIVLNADTMAPIHALIQESVSEIPIVKYKGLLLETFSVVESLECSFNKPSQSDHGLVRRTVKLSVFSEHAKGYPYYKGNITKRLYQGGQTYNDVVFMVYANDRSNVLNDIEDSFFIGCYKIDFNFQWEEMEGITSFPLIQVLESDTYKIGATDEDIPEEFFLYNPWYDAPIIPKVYGRVPRVRMLNNFPSISIKDIAGAISGVVESNYNSGSSSIILEKYADTSSVLRQLIAIGGTVLVKMADGEVIKGTLSYNSGTAEVTLTITARDQPYATAKAYTYAQGENYTEFNLPGGIPVPNGFSFLATVILNGSNVVQDPNGFMKATINYFDNSEPDKKDTIDSVVQLTGWYDEPSGVINHEAFQETGYEPSVVSADFSNVSNGSGPITYSWPPSEFMQFLQTPVDVELWFNDPTSSSAGSGSIGDPWLIVGFIPSSPSYKCYIRNGWSKFSNNNVYAEGDGRLIKIPTGNISSVTQSTTAYGLDNMAEIVLTAAPMDMNIGATSNVVYTDAMFKDGTYDSRTEKILYEIIKESPLLSQLAGDSLKRYETTNWLPYIGVLIREVQTVSEVIDSILFQCGITMYWARDKFEIRKCALNFNVSIQEEIEGNDYIKPLLPVIDCSKFKETTCGIRAGELISVVDAENKEYIPMYFDVDYGGWEDPFYKRIKPATNRGLKSKDHLYTHHFKYIHDANSVNHAIGLALSIGHASGMATVERYLDSELLSELLYLDPLDAVLLKDFPFISTADETDAELSDDGIPRYSVASDGKQFIMGAVVIVDRIDFSLTSDVPVSGKVSFKQSQLFTNARGVSVYNPPYPPVEPSDPPGDPNSPPNGGSGSSGSHGYGGSYSPMQAIWSDPAAIEIDSTGDETSPFTLTVDDGFIFNGGWSYSFIITALDGSSTIYDAEGAHITGDATGTFADKLNDSYVPVTKNINLVVNYKWFIGMPTSVVSRPIKLTLRRQIKYNANSPFTYYDYQHKIINVTLDDVVDIITE